ncbi:hypothetical protein WME95_12680 [Sorangium sp. So ce327]|jgi:hypothetical protein|uniref:hypothetical protein n=1 Tax=Sorangium sp. So ce327 TaxID=3133301 RepID=UPI003F64313D
MNTVKIAAVVAAAASIATTVAEANATVYRFHPLECQQGTGDVYKCPVPHWFTNGLDDVEKVVVDFTNALPASSYYCTDSHNAHDAMPSARACVTYSDISTGAFGSSCNTAGEWALGDLDSDGGPGIVSLDHVGLDPNWIGVWYDHPFGYAWIEFDPGGYSSLLPADSCSHNVPPVTFRGYRVHVN